MNDRIRALLSQITALEDEMRTALHEQETKMFFEIKGRRVEFESAVRKTHRKLKNNFFRCCCLTCSSVFIKPHAFQFMALPKCADETTSFWIGSILST